MADVQTLRRQLLNFFEDLKQFGPKRGDVIDLDMRQSPPSDVDQEQDIFEGPTANPSQNVASINEVNGAPEAIMFSKHDVGPNAPTAAVDAGILRLGETEEGIVICVRAAVIVRDVRRKVIGRVRSGPIFLAWKHEADLLLRLGQLLGDPGYYVITEQDERGVYHAKGLKNGVGGRKYLADRFRAGIERWCQRLAAASVNDGTLLLDGSLTLRSRDTPDTFLHQIAYLAAQHQNNIVALSKTSELIVGGRNIKYWLDDQTPAAYYRAMTPLLRQEDARSSSRRGGRADRILGNVYAVRLSSLAETYRVDVKAARGVSDEAAIRQFYASTAVYCGYPRALAEAHAACYVSAADYIGLQLQAVRDFGLRPRRRMPLTAAFSPFGGTFK